MKTRTFSLLGYKIEVFTFGQFSYMYPSFNGNAEFRTTKSGFKSLYHYIRMVKWLDAVKIT